MTARRRERICTPMNVCVCVPNTLAQVHSMECSTMIIINTALNFKAVAFYIFSFMAQSFAWRRCC